MSYQFGLLNHDSSHRAFRGLRRQGALVFVNRAAGRRRTQAYLPRIRNLFESLDSSVQFVETRSAIELQLAARKALTQERRVLLAMGGDGTFPALARCSGATQTSGSSQPEAETTLPLRSD